MPNMYSYGFYKVLIVLLCLCELFETHPQCVDSRPPFRVKDGLKFCNEYASFGCCTRNKDSELFEKYELIAKYYSVSQTCLVYLKELLCTVCSPYAAHIYDVELTSRSLPFPGICNAYCNSLHTNCQNIVQYLTNSSVILQSLTSKNVFCSRVELFDNDYCYPELKTNPELTSKVRNVQRNVDGCLCVEEFARNLSNPVFARTPMDGTDRMFVGEQIGLIHIFYGNKSRVQEPFLDMRQGTLTTDSEGDERGFLGLAFHPKYSENGKLYIYYSTTISAQEYIRISELNVTASNPNKADPKSERNILEIKQPAWNHNGGEILFGDDGYLYLFIGDGGKQGDPSGNGQNKGVLLAKVLRIDIDKQDPGLPYAIPRDNPFVNEIGSRPEIYAYGVRNIWRCGKDRGDPRTGQDKGRIICGDVGQNAFEEIDIITKGGNYGWNIKEGFSCFKNNPLCGKIGENLPIYSYAHKNGKSVTGGHIYRGCQFPNLHGNYVYADFMNGRIWKLKENKVTSTWTNNEIFMCKPNICLSNQGLHVKYEKHIISFGEDEAGELYFTTTSLAVTNNGLGKVYKLIDPHRREDPEVCRKQKKPRPRSTLKPSVMQRKPKQTQSARRPGSLNPSIAVKIYTRNLGNRRQRKTRFRFRRRQLRRRQKQYRRRGQKYVTKKGVNTLILPTPMPRILKFPGTKCERQRMTFTPVGGSECQKVWVTHQVGKGLKYMAKCSPSMAFDVAKCGCRMKGIFNCLQI